MLDDGCEAVGGMRIGRRNRSTYFEKTCPSTTLFATNLTWPDLGSNPDRRGGNPATNRLSYGTAFHELLGSFLKCFAFKKCSAPYTESGFLSGTFWSRRSLIPFISFHTLGIRRYVSLYRGFVYCRAPVLQDTTQCRRERVSNIDSNCIRTCYICVRAVQDHAHNTVRGPCEQCFYFSLF
jgi:hypothetical protein